MYSSYYNYSSPSTYSYSSSSSSSNIASVIGAFIASMGVAIAISIALIVLVYVAYWKIFKKAGREGWEGIVPIHNTLEIFRMGGLPGAYIFIVLFAPIIPFVGWIVSVVFMFIMNIHLAHSFGKSTGFGVGLTLLGFIFYPILAFGSATYLGPEAGNVNPTYTPNAGYNTNPGYNPNVNAQPNNYNPTPNNYVNTQDNSQFQPNNQQPPTNNGNQQ